jgi:hypothetical protein
VRRKRRPAVERNDASVVDHLVQDHDVIGVWKSCT